MPYTWVAKLKVVLIILLGLTIYSYAFKWMIARYEMRGLKHSPFPAIHLFKSLPFFLIQRQGFFFLGMCLVKNINRDS